MTTPEGTRRAEAQRWGRRGSLQAQRGDWPAAAEAFERARALAPDELAAYRGLAHARFALQDLDSIRRLADELGRRFPAAAFTHLLRGHLHKAFGETVAARAAYHSALKREPTLGEALFGIVDLAIPAPDDTLAAQATEIASRDDLPAADRINAGFAVARIMDKAGDHQQAFRFLQQANTLAHDELAGQGIRYQPEQMEKRVAGHLQTYNADSFATPLDPLPIDLLPVFIIGLPRSGTTLLEQILAGHPDVEAGGELTTAHQCEARFRAQREQAGRRGPVDASNPVDRRLLEDAREHYVDALFERGLEGPRVVDKMPANFEIAGFLRLMFPDAPIIHSVRDLRATAFSLYSANFAGHEPYYHTLEDLAHYCSLYQRLMRHWQAVLPGPFINVAYEELVSDPDRQIPALLESTGLTPHPGCLDFHRHQRPVLTASHSQVRQPMHTGAIARWRHYRQWLGPLNTLAS
ncbi:hypothetical protein CWI75_16200 [Kineobactrum sediminis]|uniref:Uncharacterized protein n=1 Tax=Kineobactrum sediminis TaxID=1905677 RepID=A0A2N5XZ22_9GAMM|nr:sulfotransferase [Kineobactrum sediminis]PLW81373.1 hypothetical protein CWI75_16200 [Kineobactrum sediminis]